VYRIILTIVGFMILNIIGAFIGYFIGSNIDRGRRYGIGGMNPLSARQRQKVFLDTVFILMGKLAKADGHISRNEIDHVEAFIQKLGLNTEHRQEAISQFKKGSEVDFDIKATLTEFMESCGNTLNLKQMLLMYLIVMALADGKLDNSERNVLEAIAGRLGYSANEFNHVLEMVMNQANFSSSSSRPSSSNAISEAYKALGVTKDNSDQEIKRAYRKLMSEHHPDKLMGQGLPEDMIKVATEKSQEIQKAYDIIKKHRQTK
jgi:DnaJ like chaperone protein